MIQINPGAEGGEVTPLLEKAVRLTLESQGATVLEISISLLGDEAIQALNRTYLSHDWVTDVISFPLNTPTGELMGDVYVGADQARRQAQVAGVPVLEELARLTIHGTLHVLGHEHPEGEDRLDAEMYRIQEALVAQLMGRD